MRNIKIYLLIIYVLLINSSLNAQTTEPTIEINYRERYVSIIRNLFSSDIDIENNEQNIKLLLSYRKKICKDLTPNIIVDFWNRSEENRKNSITKNYDNIINLKSEIHKISLSSINKDIANDREIAGNSYVFSSMSNKNKYNSQCLERIRSCKENIVNLEDYSTNEYPLIDYSDDSIGILKHIKEKKNISQFISLCLCGDSENEFYAVIKGLPNLDLDTINSNINQYVFQRTNKTIEIKGLAGNNSSRTFAIIKSIEMEKFLTYEKEKEGNSN